MAAATPIMPFLRPSALPRPATFRHFLRFSTTTRPCQAAQSTPSTASQDQDPNLLASLKASPTYPPPSMNSLPRPKESRASHRANHPTTPVPTTRTTKPSRLPRRPILHPAPPHLHPRHP
ncbi:hypothetical protein KC361_g9558, partial [Hortaea werneckii]